MNEFGFFNEDGTEFIITKPELAKEFDNYLFNDSIFSYIQHTGVGYCTFQIDGTELTDLIPGNNLYEYKRQNFMMNRLVFIRDQADEVLLIRSPTRTALCGLFMH